MDVCKDLKRWRRALHQIPELGLQEIKTTTYIEEQLVTMGYTPTKVLDTGTLVYLDCGKEETIAFRADIDALPIVEQTNCDFTSNHQGYMHACGHDGHTSALLGLAKVLKEKQDTLVYNILLLFQPAEESPGGAKLLIEQEVLKKYKVKAIFGMHLMPSIEEGVVACRPGPLMAQNGELDVMIQGKSAHAGLYHQGIDSIMIASSLLMQYQNIISRIIAPTQPVVLHVGELHGGTARNIVAESAHFHGTLRAYDEDVFLQMTKAIGEINASAEQIYGCKITWNCPPMYPPVINHRGLYKQFVNCVHTKYIELEEPLMLAEDFSYYQKEIPGIFFFLGTKTKEYYSGLHTETFNFNEEVLQIAVDTFYQIATNIRLGEK